MTKAKTTKARSIMVLFGEQMWIDIVLIDDDHHIIDKFIRRDTFRVSHTDLTYRQINYLDRAGLLGTGREDTDRGWRVFRFRDVVYLNVISELKKFGIGNELLRSIHELFYDNEHVMDEVILLCLLGIEMTLVFGYDGKGYLLNPAFLTMYDRDGLFTERRQAAEIRLVINRVVNAALKAMDKPEREITHSVAALASDRLINAKPSEIEMKILEVIRNDNYQEIRLKKKDGKPYVLYASSEGKSDLSERELLAEVSKLNFTDVEIKKRDGKVVHYRQAKTIKL